MKGQIKEKGKNITIGNTITCMNFDAAKSRAKVLIFPGASIEWLKRMWSYLCSEGFVVDTMFLVSLQPWFFNGAVTF